MNVIPYTVQTVDGWIPQVRYSRARDLLSRTTDGDEIIWECGDFFPTAEEAVEVAQSYIDRKIKGVFA